MGHLIFIILHCAAFLFGCFGLFITIPLHVIYCMMQSKQPKQSEELIKQNKHSQQDLDQWAINKEKNKQRFVDSTITNTAGKMILIFICLFIIVGFVKLFLMPA